MQLTDTDRKGHSLVRGEITSVSASSMRPGMDVRSFGGEHLGRVKAVDDIELIVERPWLPDARVPLERVLTVARDNLILTRLGPPQAEPTPGGRQPGRLWSRLTMRHP
jgi:hypothetical protein